MGTSKNVSFLQMPKYQISGHRTLFFFIILKEKPFDIRRKTV